MSSAPRRRTSRYSFYAEVALAGLVVFCPLVLGSAPAWVLWPLVLLAWLAATLAAVGARRQGHSLHVPLLALPLLGGAVLCLVQLVPLPVGLLRVLSPEAAALREFALVPLGLESARPLSLDPPATWRELAKHLAYGLAFLAAVQVCHSRQARRRLLITLAFTGAGVAVLGLLHALLGLTSLFGVRPYVHAQPPLVTPFGNPNHLAGFLGLSATVAVGLALSSNRRSRAARYAVAALLAGAGVLLSLSRAGILFFVFGQGLLAALLVLRQRQGLRKGGRTARVWGPGAAVLLGLLATLAVGGYVAWEKLETEVSSADSVEELSRSKVDLWPMVAAAARSFWGLGMGRGAFEAAFPRYQTEPSLHTLTHPENAVLQLAVEFGVPGLVLLAVAVWGFVRLLRREGLSGLELAVLAGVAALALHNLFDFSLELPACAVAALVALAAVARPEVRGASGGPRGLAPRLALGGAAALAVLALGALIPGRHLLAEAEAELAGLLRERAPLAEVRARGLALIDRHPADYLLYSLIGSAYATGSGATAGEALAFVNRVLYLRPLDAAAHRTAARALLTLGRRGQAFLEYRMAHESGDREVLVREALGRARTLSELQALTPDSVEVAAELARVLAARTERQEQALAYLAWARERFDAAPGSALLWEREARLRMGRHELAEAEALCAEAERRAPDVLATQLLRADLLWKQGRREESIQFLERILPRFPGQVELSFALANQLLTAGLTRRARDVLQRTSPFVTNFSQRVQLLLLEGACFEREGFLTRALDRYQTVTRLAPTPGAYFEVARLHEALRRYGAAAQAVREGMRLLPPGGRGQREAWVARLEAQERRLMEAQREQIANDPEAQETEELLRGTSEESP